MSDVLEYLTENSRINYPFKDNCTLAQRYSNLSALPVDAFLDFQLVASTKPISRLALRSLAVVSPEGDPQPAVMLVFVCLYSDNSLGVFDFIVDKPTATKQLFTVTSDGVFFRFITGDSVWQMEDGTSYRLLVDFTEGCSAEFCSSTIINPVAQVTSTTFKNYPDTSIYSFGVSDIVKLKAQANVVAEQINVSSLYLDVLKGAGSGLYNACVSYDGEITRLNNSTADSQGNLLLEADNCHHIINRISSHQIAIDFPCRDSICDSQEVQNLAYYINRLRHGMQDLNQYIQTVVASFTEQFNIYKALQEAKAAANAPYIEADYSVYTNAGKNNIAFSVGIYDPNRSKLSLSLTAIPTALNSGGSPIVGAAIQNANKSLYPGTVNPDTWTGWVQLYGKTSLKEKVADYTLSPSLVTDPTVSSGVKYFANRVIDCRDVVALSSGFTLTSGEADKNLNSSIEWKLKQTGVDYPSTAYKRCVVLPKDLYFNVKSRRIYMDTATNPYYHYYVTFEIFTTLVTLANPILANKNTALVIDLTHPFDFVPNTAFRISNGVATALPVFRVSGINHAYLSMSATPLTYPDRQVIQFEVKSVANPAMAAALEMSANVLMVNGATTYYYPGPSDVQRLSFTVD